MSKVKEGEEWLFNEPKSTRCGRVGVQHAGLTKRADGKLTYEEEERIAIQQEGSGRRIDIVIRDTQEFLQDP